MNTNRITTEQKNLIKYFIQRGYTNDTINYMVFSEQNPNGHYSFHSIISLLRKRYETNKQ